MSGRGGVGIGGREMTRKREEKNTAGGGHASAPPSRHLWVGNLSHLISEGELVRPFLRFGELDSVAFHPGRSYAFINFKVDEAAIAALKALQGIPLGGNPLRIEFAKDKSSISSHDEEHLEHRNEHTSSRASPHLQKDFRVRNGSPEPFHSDKHKGNDKVAEPSEVLWIGFPALLKVDETILRKAFSPFGEIEKITTFPGRSYAFIRFRNLMSACRAKDTLQGKLFGNPRVHICFAKNESGSSGGARSSISGAISPRYQSNSRDGSSESFWHDCDIASLTGHPSVGSPHFITNLDREEHDAYNNRKRNSRMSVSLEHGRFGGEASKLMPSESMHEFHGSPRIERGAHLSYPSHTFSQKGSSYEDEWDLPEEVEIFLGAKRLRTNEYPPDNELPEYPLSDLRREKQPIPHALYDSLQSDIFGKNIEYEQMVRSNGHLRASYNDIQVDPASLPTVPIERKKINQPSLKEWKWEGTIAKGGTPICRARCFPVGKVLDFELPEFLDCTARTGLDMLAKHYYQASGTWVVFFVPGTDIDIVFYNEFMHYLEEKHRAAVAKLDGRNTLFLVPPSDFSEKVLKVPGKMSISGVILRLEQSGSKFGFINQPHELKDPKFSSFSGSSICLKSSTPSGPDFLGMAKLQPGISVNAPLSVPLLVPTNASSKFDAYSEDRCEYQPQQENLWQPNSSSYSMATSTSGIRVMRSPVLSITSDSFPEALQAGKHSGFPLSGNMPAQDGKTSVQSSLPVVTLQPEQLAQLASLLGQQRQSGTIPNISAGRSDGYGLSNIMATSLPHFTEVQQQQIALQQTNVSAVSDMLQAGSEGSQQVSSAGSQEAESDPQKRLQATLQLAAALLQQIQQGKAP